MKIAGTLAGRFVICAAFLVCGEGLRATTIERMSIERMSRAAPLIVRAQCVSNATAWDAGEIWTFTTFQVLETWKGPSAQVPQQITVRLLGGTVGALTSHVSGIPRFQVGEEVVLFLERTARGDSSVVSWQQGTFRIMRGPRMGEGTVTQDTAAFATFDPHTRRFEASGIRKLALSSLRQRVESAVRNDSGESK